MTPEEYNKIAARAVSEETEQIARRLSLVFKIIDKLCPLIYNLFVVRHWLQSLHNKKGVKLLDNKEIALHLTVAAMENGVITFEDKAEAVKNIVSFYDDICSELSAPSNKVVRKPSQQLRTRVYNN